MSREYSVRVLFQNFGRRVCRLLPGLNAGVALKYKIAT